MLGLVSARVCSEKIVFAQPIKKTTGVTRAVVCTRSGSVKRARLQILSLQSHLYLLGRCIYQNWKRYGLARSQRKDNAQNREASRIVYCPKYCSRAFRTTGVLPLPYRKQKSRCPLSTMVLHLRIYCTRFESTA